MRKLLIALILLATPAFGAMTCVEGAHEREARSKVVKLTCTADATPATSVATLDASMMEELGGMFLYSITTDPGATGPTDNSDLQIADSRGVNIVTATGNGANVIDNSATNQLTPEGPETIFYQMAHSGYAWTITVTNNAVASSFFDIYFEMIDGI